MCHGARKGPRPSPAGFSLLQESPLPEVSVRTQALDEAWCQLRLVTLWFYSHLYLQERMYRSFRWVFFALQWAIPCQFCRRPGRENSIALPSPPPTKVRTEFHPAMTTQQGVPDRARCTLLIFIYYILAVQGIVARSCMHQELCFRAISPDKVGTFCNHIWFFKKKIPSGLDSMPDSLKNDLIKMLTEMEFETKATFTEHYIWTCVRYYRGLSASSKFSTSSRLVRLFHVWAVYYVGC